MLHAHAIVTLAACACNCNTLSACTASIVWTAPCKPPPSSPPLPLPDTPPRDTPARFKAASYNASYAGAMFPWESAVWAGTSGDCFRTAPKQLIFLPEEFRQFGSVRVLSPAVLVPCRSPSAHAPPPPPNRISLVYDAEADYHPEYLGFVPRSFFARFFPCHTHHGTFARTPRVFPLTIFTCTRGSQ